MDSSLAICPSMVQNGTPGKPCGKEVTTPEK